MKKYLKKNIYLLVLMALLSYNLLFSQYDVNSVQSSLVSKYGNITSISTDFIGKGNKDIKGSFIAKKGNKFKMTISDRQIICDGKTTWVYVPKENRVVISNFEESEANSFEQIFYKLMKCYKVTKISKENKSNGKTSVIAELEPIDNSKKLNGLDKITLWLNPSDWSIDMIKTQGTQSETWILSNLAVNKKVSDKIFDFQPPKGCATVDIR